MIIDLVAQEAKAKFRFRELKRKATAHQEGLLQPHHKWDPIILCRSRNVDVLQSAFREFYLNLILLQSYQV